jgi:molybdate transport system substrate-binding protein
MATIKVFTTNSLCGSATELYARFERASGHTVDATYGPAKAILRDIAGGASADLALLGTGSIDELLAQGVLDRSTLRAIAASGVGIGVKAGAAKPDVSTPEKVIAALRAAPSIAHTTEGASGMYFGKLLIELGLADELKPKLRTQPGGMIGEVLVAGGAALGIQQVSELMAIPGVELAGTLPAPWQRMFANSGALFASTPQRAAAQALLDYMVSSEAAVVYRARGLEPVA